MAPYPLTLSFEAAQAPRLTTTPPCTPMHVDENRDLILDGELLYAQRLATVVLSAPTVHVWMILIPIIFVMHFFRLKRIKEGRVEFVEGFMHGRRAALDALWTVAREQGETPLTDATREAVLDELCANSTASAEAAAAQRTLYARLLEHYADMLQARGDSYGDLVRNAYGRREDYLLFLKQLSDAERDLNKAVQQGLTEDAEGAEEVVEAMGRLDMQLRREQAEAIFP